MVLLGVEYYWCQLTIMVAFEACLDNETRRRRCPTRKRWYGVLECDKCICEMTRRIHALRWLGQHRRVRWKRSLSSTRIMPTNRWHIRMEQADCESQKMTSIDLKVLEGTSGARFFIFKTYSSAPRRGENIDNPFKGLIALINDGGVKPVPSRGWTAYSGPKVVESWERGHMITIINKVAFGSRQRVFDKRRQWRDVGRGEWAYTPTSRKAGKDPCQNSKRRVLPHVGSKSL